VDVSALGIWVSPDGEGHEQARRPSSQEALADLDIQGGTDGTSDAYMIVSDV
jgi:hypothetical protein